MDPEQDKRGPKPEEGAFSSARPGQGMQPQPRRMRWSSEELLAGVREALIEHRGEVYRLRCTSKGRLILTK